MRVESAIRGVRSRLESTKIVFRGSVPDHTQEPYDAPSTQTPLADPRGGAVGPPNVRRIFIVLPLKQI